ncbi:MAG: hypothetical protein ABL921_07885 [Pirellula sp.]
MNGTPDQSTQTSRDDASLRSGIALGICMALLLAMGIAINQVYFANVEMPFFQRVTILALLVWLASRSNVVILLAFALAAMVIQEKPNPSWFGLGQMAFQVFSSMLLLYWVSHFQAIRRKIYEAFIDYYQLGSDSKTLPVASLDRRLAAMAQSAGLLIVKLAVSMQFAWLLLQNQSQTINASPWLHWSITTKQILWPGPTLIAIILLVLIVAHEIGWRQLTVDQKKMYLRTVALRANYADLRQIVRARLKKRPS